MTGDYVVYTYNVKRPSELYARKYLRPTLTLQRTVFWLNTPVRIVLTMQIIFTHTGQQIPEHTKT